MKIRLKEMKLQNFKGVREKELVFGDTNSVIEGDNGVGKTTIYDAYLWCLFGKTSGTNQTVQMLDSNNNIIHKIDTKVEVKLLINDNEEVRLTRSIVEKWKNIGTVEEKFIGTEVQRFYNGVPVNMSEFNSKLAALLDLDTWTTLSNRSNFMQLKTEDRRKWLIDMCGGINEEELVKPYPSVKKGLSENKTIEELTKEVKATKKLANKKLIEIPAKIAAQDKLRVDYDFEKIEQEIKEIDVTLSDIDNQLQGSSKELESVRQYKAKKKELEDKLLKAKKKCQEEYNEELSYIDREIRETEKAQWAAMDSSYRAAAQNEKDITLLNSLYDEKQKSEDKWREINKEKFTYTEEEVCPYCGQLIPEEVRQREKDKVVKMFNEQKSKDLEMLENSIKTINQRIATLKGKINEFKEITDPSLRNSALEKENLVKELEEKRSKLELKDSEEVLQITKELENLVAPVDDSNEMKEEIVTHKKLLMVKRDERIKVLAQREVNNTIEKEKEELNNEARELGQLVADCNNTLYQINEYKKAKIEAVESKVNHFFKYVTWKFYEKNLTNDDLQEICTCLVDGRDYNNLNQASRINAEIDIINGICKAEGIDCIPLFLDNRESVINLIESNNQIISLKVVEGSKFNLINL